MAALLPTGFRHALFVAIASVLLVYKALFVLRFSPWLGAVGLCVELGVLYLGALVAELAARRGFTRAASGVYAAFALGLSATLLSHAFFFEQAQTRRFSLLDLSLADVIYFFEHVIPKLGIVSFVLAFLAIAVLARRFARRGTPLSERFAGRTVSACAVAAVGTFAAGPTIPSPVMDLVYDAIERATTRELVVREGTALPAPLAVLDKSGAPPAGLSPRYDKVLVFVMETMPDAWVDEERAKLPEATFVNAARSHAHVFERYFSTNQDSRTGMLSMLGSRFIPHDAYTEAGRDAYLYLSKKSSLVDAMHGLGYETAFAVSQRELELVVRDYPWQRMISMDEAGIARAKDAGFLCFNPYEFEHSCEDRAILPDVLSFLDQNPRAFLYQEFIFGHAVEYNRASGRTNTDYYSSYVDSVVKHLAERGELERTLIVLTSDHGYRDTTMQDDLRVVRIPLYFYSPALEAAVDPRLFSHIELKDLLFAELGGAPLASVPEPEFVMIQGPTGSGLVLSLTREGELMLVRDRTDGARLLRHRMVDRDSRPLHDLDELARPTAFLKLAREFRRWFDAELPPS
jgi:Sulfatase